MDRVQAKIQPPPNVVSVFRSEDAFWTDWDSAQASTRPRGIGFVGTDVDTSHKAFWCAFHRLLQSRSHT